VRDGAAIRRDRRDRSSDSVIEGGDRRCELFEEFVDLIFVVARLPIGGLEKDTACTSSTDRFPYPSSRRLQLQEGVDLVLV